MHQVTGATAVAGHFVDGTTIVNADWLNTIQDELCHFITAQGIELNQAGQDDAKQLLAALAKFGENFAKESDALSKEEFKNTVSLLNTSIESCLLKTDFNQDVLLQEDGTNLLVWMKAWIEKIVSVKYPEMPQ